MESEVNYTIRDLFCIVEHIGCPNAVDGQIQGSKIGVAAPVMIRLSLMFMVSPVDFDNEFGFVAVEIADEAPNGVLAAKAQPVR